MENDEEERDRREYRAPPLPLPLSWERKCLWAPVEEEDTAENYTGNSSRTFSSSFSPFLYAFLFAPFIEHVRIHALRFKWRPVSVSFSTFRFGNQMTRIGNIGIWSAAIFVARNTSAHKLLRSIVASIQCFAIVPLLILSDSMFRNSPSFNPKNRIR